MYFTHEKKTNLLYFVLRSTSERALNLYFYDVTGLTCVVIMGMVLL